MRKLYILLLLFVPGLLHAQAKYTISGYVKDSLSGESLIAASIQVKGTTLGAYTNAYGFFSISLPEGNYPLVISYIGYRTDSQFISLNKDVRLNVNLNPAARQVQEIVIQAKKDDQNVTSTDMGKIEMPIDKVKNLPVAFGEVDILKTLQLLPGVQGGAEGTSGLYVRGGGPDQNLILMDGAVVYNSSHLLGFFSIFNSDAVLNTTLFKGGMPAEYGGRISSVLDISMKEGNNQTFHVSGGIGLIASRLTFEGPIKKNKGSFIISARRTYIDLVTKPYVNTTKYKGTGYYFYDLNAKMNWKFSDKDRLYLSGYYGKDVFNFNNNGLLIGIPWGNATATLRWNHLFSSKLFMNASVMYSAYNFQLNATQNNFNLSLYSGINDATAKVDFDFYASPRHEIKYGVNYIFHTFIPSSISGQSGDVVFNPNNITHHYAHEAAAYIEDNFKVSEKRIEINGGLRFSAFQQIGPSKTIIYGYTGLPSDSIVYKAGQPIKTYGGIEPRLQVRYSVGKTSSIKASFNVNNQYVHLVSDNGTTLPTDIWVPSSALVKPQQGIQYSMGYFKNFKKNMFETSVEVYYKDMKNQIEYKEGYTPSPNEDLEQSFVFGKGNSKGIEFFINKRAGRLTGWIGYTLSYTTEQFPDLNNGQPFPYRFDRRHDVSIVASYKLNKHWSLGAVFVFQTGIAYTLPVGKYFIEGDVVTQYGAINSYRLEPYDRLDLSANFEGKPHKKFQDGWSFSVYNVYNRQNPYFIYDQVNGEFLSSPSVTIQAKQVTLFPIIPSVTWNFKF